ncbi:MAG: aspartate kinase [Steroidobacteraceae bacterium]
MSRLVQKFGGTSVGSPQLIRQVAERIARTCAARHEVAVVVSAMGDSTDRLIDLARQVVQRPMPRELDALLATGEQVSTSLLAMALNALGVEAKSFSGWQLPIQTSAVHGRARIEAVATTGLRSAMAQGIVPVVAGFQGVDTAGNVTTIGRGGSDTSAVALAVALEASECQILTDVDGVFTTDPRLVPGARLIPKLSFEEMLELAGQGSRVLHARSVEFATKYNMPIRVASTHGFGDGTLISREEANMEAPLVSGIAFNRDEAQLTVTGLPIARDIVHRVLQPFAAAHIEIDMIALTQARNATTEISFTVDREHYAVALELVRAAVSGVPGAAVEGDARVAKIAVVGVGMRSHAGVAAKMFETLSNIDVPVRLISTSEIKIAALVPEKTLELAVKELHAAFGLDGLKEVSGTR